MRGGFRDWKDEGQQERGVKGQEQEGGESEQEEETDTVIRT